MKTIVTLYVLFFALLFPSQSGNLEEEKSSRQEKKIFLKLLRTSENSASTTGELFVNDKFICHTLEKPWKDNKSFISSIPAGVYDAILRYDKPDEWRIQLTNVPDRSGVQFHIGTIPKDTQGCILVGDEVYNHDNRLGLSASAYSRLKEAFYGSPLPDQTPNVDFVIIVVNDSEKTVFDNNLTNSNKNKYLYLNKGLWQDTNASNPKPTQWLEYKRDLKYIFLKDPSIGLFIRIPIHGGSTERAFSQGGPWRSTNINYTRAN